MHQKRIDKMLHEGLLTKAQAEALHSSLSPPNPPRQPRRKLLPVIAIGVAVVLIGFSLSALLMTGADEGGKEIHNISEMLNVTGGTGAMNKPLSTLTSMVLLLLPLVLVVIAFTWFYNGIVDKEEQVYQSWSQVESNLQRRADLIPNLVDTVSRYMQHERDTLTDLTDKRAEGLNPLAEAMDQLISDHKRAAQSGSDVQLDDEAALEDLARTQQTLSGSLRHFVAVAENYPNLRSGDQFLALQAQLEGSENRINVARMEFNRSVGDFNSAIRRLPGSLIAGMGNFKRKAYFQADEGTDTPVDVGEAL